MIQGRTWRLFVAFLLTTVTVGIAHAEFESMPGEYVVVLKPNTVRTANENGLRSVFKAQAVQVLTHDRGTLLVKRGLLERPEFVAADLLSNPAVEVVEPNYIYHINAVPNDPMLGELWGMQNDGKNNGVVGTDIDAVKAWDIETGSQKVVVGVIDTGIDYTHPDLVENVWTNEAEANGQPGVDDDGNGFVDDIHGYDFANNDGDPMDDHGHGTHVSGTIGAKGNDGKGIVGVNWDVRIMGLKFLTGSGSGTLANAVRAVDYAVLMGVNLTSNSWGGGGFSQALYDAIKRAQDKGQLFIAAAGNESNDNDTNPGYPASYDLDNIISVAAVDRTGAIADFSNYGATTVDVAAPGVDVYSSFPGGQYKSWAGTSMATPHVSGVAALLMAHDSSLTYQDVKARIIRTAKPLSSMKGKAVSGGLVSAYNALLNILPPPDPNDPANWKDSKEVSAETSHPYTDKAKQEWTFSQPGAKRIAIYFDRFETESVYDYVELYDAQGTLVGKLTGSHNAQFSPVINGDTVRVVFMADDSVTRYGFSITKLAYE